MTVQTFTLGAWAQSGRSNLGVFESIASATGTGTGTSITFSSISSAYQHLQLRIIARDSDAATARTLTVRANNDSATNYSIAQFSGNGTTTSISSNITQAQMGNYTITAASTSANILGVWIIDIHDYASTVKAKTFRVFGGYDSNGAGSNGLYTGLWNSTSAINRLDLLTNGTGFTTQTQVALYGIRGA